MGGETNMGGLCNFLSLNLFARGYILFYINSFHVNVTNKEIDINFVFKTCIYYLYMSIAHILLISKYIF